MSSTSQPHLRDLVRRLARILRPYRYVLIALFLVNFVLGLFFVAMFVAGPPEQRPIALQQMIILFGLAGADALFLLAMRAESTRAAED